jgi:hypothetical protein
MTPTESGIAGRTMRLEPFNGSDVMISIRTFMDQGLVDGHQAVLTVRDTGDSDWIRTINLINREG